MAIAISRTLPGWAWSKLYMRPYAGRIPTGLPRVPEEVWDPQPESLLQLGLARYRAGERDDLYALEPLYLRPSSAEEKWQTLKDRGTDRCCK